MQKDFRFSKEKINLKNDISQSIMKYTCVRNSDVKYY